MLVPRKARILLLLVGGICTAWPALAQLPFYTDNPQVTDRGAWHFEFFDEYDSLQSSEYPDFRQNTANFKLNYGLPHNLELDVDTPHLAIFRVAGEQNSLGLGDTNMGVKWNFRSPPQGSRSLALAASLYIEFPTGNSRQQLGSGLTDYWLNFIAQEPFTSKTRMNLNLGYLFAGNTSTGAIGIQTTRGHVLTGGLSLQHDFTPRLMLGGEVYGGIADNDQLGRKQVQGLVGGQYTVRNGLNVTLGLLGGKYEASPRVGGQVGFSVDFPAIRHNSDAK